RPSDRVGPRRVRRGRRPRRRASPHHRPGTNHGVLRRRLARQSHPRSRHAVTAGDNRAIVPAVATVVTLSAPYGTGGSRIGPAVAERLGLPFLDRAIPVAVAESLAVPLRDAIAHDDRREAGIGRALA